MTFKRKNLFLLVALIVIVTFAVIVKLQKKLPDQILSPLSNSQFITSKDFKTENRPSISKNIYLLDPMNNLHLITRDYQDKMLTHNKQVLSYISSISSDKVAFLELDECHEENYIRLDCPQHISVIDAREPENKIEVYTFKPKKIEEMGSWTSAPSFEFSENEETLSVMVDEKTIKTYSINGADAELIKTSKNNKTISKPPTKIIDTGDYIDYIDPQFSPDKKHILYRRQLYENSDVTIYDPIRKRIIKDLSTYSTPNDEYFTFFGIGWLDNDQVLVKECQMFVSEENCKPKIYSISNNQLLNSSINLEFFTDGRVVNSEGDQAYYLTMNPEKNAIELKSFGKNDQSGKVIREFSIRKECKDCKEKTAESVIPTIIGFSDDEKYVYLYAHVYKYNVERDAGDYQFGALLAIPVNEEKTVIELTRVSSQ